MKCYHRKAAGIRLEIMMHEKGHYTWAWKGQEYEARKTDTKKWVLRGKHFAMDFVALDDCIAHSCGVTRSQVKTVFL